MNNSNRNIEEFKCPNCGAPTVFNPLKGLLNCEYCEYEKSLQNLTSEYEFNVSDGAVEDSSWRSEAKVVHCDNCGADNVLNVGQMSSLCPFCGSNQIVLSQQISGIKPHRIIPFKVDKTQVRERYNKWLKRKIFVPRKVKKQIPNCQLNGVYLPVWTFDSTVISTYDGKLGKHYTRTVGSGNNRRTVTETKYFYVSGTKNIFFDDCLVNAGSHITQNEINAISPFDTNNSYVFEHGYLAGFSSEHYTVRLEEGWDIAKKKMEQGMRQRILRDYVYDVVVYLNVNSTFHNSKYKYVLIPVWVGVYQYKNKTYRFVANGVTNKISGKAPVSALRVIIFILLIIISILALVLLTQLE